MNPDIERSEKALRRVEEMLNCTLPIDYRMFMLASDASSNPCYYFEFQYGSVSKRVGMLSYVEAFEYLQHAIDIVFVAQLAIERPKGSGLYPRHCLPIADGFEEEDILLYVSGPKYGEVWIKTWDTLHETGIDNADDDLYFVAKTFAEFVAMWTKPHPGEEGDGRK